MDTGVAIITGLFGGGSIIGFVQYLISRHDTNKSQLNRIEKKVDTIGEKTDRNELAICRQQLFFLIIMQPDNKDAILKTAQRYFVELDGNGEAWDAFQHWADTYQVNTAWYLNLVEKEKRKRGESD